MNVLFVGNYRENSGWAIANRDYIRSLISVGVNVAARPLYLSSVPSNYQLEPDLVDSEFNSFDSYDAVIQAVMPHLFSYNSHYNINVGLPVFETAGLDYSNWANSCGLMDKIFTTVWQDNFKIPGKTKTYSIGQAVNLSKFTQEWEPLELKSGFNFYFVGEYISRKNLQDLLIAFHTEFTVNEPVNLIIKTNKFGISPQTLAQKISQDINSLKQQLRLYSDPQLYKNETLITNFLSEENLNRLHASCHCFVMPSYGEAFCRPLIEAMGFGNQVLATDATGMANFIPPECRVDGMVTPTACSDSAIPTIFTGHESWVKINVQDLKRKMRAAYEQGPQKIKYDMTQFSYQSVGNKMLEALKT